MQKINETVRHLAAEVLNIAEVSSTDDFFELGGSSLSAALLVTRLEQIYGREISLRLLLENPNIGGFCHALSAADERAA